MFNFFRCCRSHDLCPVKIRAQQTRYNLTNYSVYTKYENITKILLILFLEKLFVINGNRNKLFTFLGHTVYVMKRCIVV